MSGHLPPIPPANRTDKGPAEAEHVDPRDTARPRDVTKENTSEGGRTGNIHQNTHHQGYQQDR